MDEIRQIDIENEPSIGYFANAIRSSEHIYRQVQNAKIRRHLLRQHNVLNRMREVFYFKNKMFIPSAIVLQGCKSVINFHTAYLVGNPVTITGTPKAVELMNKCYRKGIYSKTDWEILKELVTYGNAFEYVYLDKNGTIKSKVFRNKDAFPIYDENMVYSYFVEHWVDQLNKKEHYVIYYPTHVDEYINNNLVSCKPNYTGLPIHYAAMDKGEYDQYGDSMMLDLIPIQDKIESLLSKLDDAVTTLSLNPVGVITGTRMTEQDMVDSNIAGAVLNLDEGNNFKYANAVMDYQCIKYELDQLYQQFNLVAGIPSSILGQNNIANVSENSMSMVYQLTENKGKQNMNSLVEGFRARFDKMRILMNLLGEYVYDKDFDSLNVTFNISKPIDTKQNMENMKTQYDMGAISKRTIMEQSPYTTDSAQEMQRLNEEGKPINDLPDKSTDNKSEDSKEDEETEE